jgi:hypothetical protein
MLRKSAAALAIVFCLMNVNANGHKWEVADMLTCSAGVGHTFTDW